MDARGYWSGPIKQLSEGILQLNCETNLCINTSLKEFCFLKYIRHLALDDSLLLELVTINKVMGRKSMRISACNDLSRFRFECSASLCCCIENLMTLVRIINVGK